MIFGNNWIRNFLLAALLYFISINIRFTNGHGRLIEPPSRASAWRYGFQTPPNYNDHELYCGGYQRQWSKNEGKCGECGDPWDIPEPRPHEFGGKWGQGVVVRKYNPGGEITIRVELTASHMGYFEFRICPEIKAKQNCLDKHVLKVMGGAPMSTNPSDLDYRFYPRNGSRIYDIKAQLPEDMKCDQCVLQWRYVAGNNWGNCPDGSGAVGCGPQEEFRACADISIGETGRTTIRPIRPGVKTTKQSSKKPTTEQQPGVSEDIPKISPIIAPFIIIIITLLIVICIFATIYLYHYHGQRVKQLLHWNRTSKDQNHAIRQEILNEKEKANNLFSIPVPPPRTKRTVSQVKEMTPNQSSIA